MDAVVLGAKAAVAVLLLVAGGAKLADLAGFAATIRMFLPADVPMRLAAVGRDAAAAIVAAELLAGAASLCWPAVGSVNLAVLAVTAGFTVVAALGYGWHRGQPCRCFGALAMRRFGARSLLQALLITAAAALAARPVRPAQVHLGPAAHLLLLTAATIVVLVAFTAARALLTAAPRPGMAG